MTHVEKYILAIPIICLHIYLYMQYIYNMQYIILYIYTILYILAMDREA